jgi:hypothetical protein
MFVLINRSQYTNILLYNTPHRFNRTETLTNTFFKQKHRFKQEIRTLNQTLIYNLSIQFPLIAKKYKYFGSHSKHLMYK